MRKKSLILLGMVVAVGVTVPSFADEVVHFTNGSTMAVRSHEVEEGTITVEIGKDSYMSFPMSLVERIEKSGRAVFNADGTSNRMVDTPRNVSMTGIRPPRHRDGVQRRQESDGDADVDPNPDLVTTSGGLTAYRPEAKSGHKAKSEVRFTGNMAVLGGQEQNPRTGHGTVPKTRIGGVTGSPRRKPPAVPLAPSRSSPPPPPPEQADDDSDD